MGQWRLYAMTALAPIALSLVAAMSAAGADRTDPDSTGANVVVMRLDSTRSRVGFTARIIWLIRASGHFGGVHGSVRLDRFRNQIRVDARIDANAVSMGNRLYEDWVKSPEFFDVAQYPRIEFSSDAIPRVRLRDGGALPGALTLRGIQHRVQFTLQPSPCDRPGRDCPIEVSGVIQRSAFAMRSRHGTVGDKVTLHFSVYAAAPEAHKLP